MIGERTVNAKGSLILYQTRVNVIIVAQLKFRLWSNSNILIGLAEKVLAEGREKARVRENNRNRGIEYSVSIKDFRTIIQQKRAAHTMRGDDRNIVVYSEVDHLLHFSSRRIPESIVRDTQRRGRISECAFASQGLEFAHLVWDCPIIGKLMDGEAEDHAGPAVYIAVQDSIGSIVGP